MATVQRGATNALDLRSFVHMKQHQETKLLLVKNMTFILFTDILWLLFHIGRGEVIIIDL